MTRQLNKDIIRSHNEVMQVIGVAEPENMLSEPQALTARHEAWENAIGLRLLAIGRFVHASGAWGVNGMRQRILVRTSGSSRYPVTSLTESIYISYTKATHVFLFLSFGVMNGVSGH